MIVGSKILSFLVDRINALECMGLDYQYLVLSPVNIVIYIAMYIYCYIYVNIVLPNDIMVLVDLCGHEVTFLLKYIRLLW